ncbi:antA/AntB antirepressor family protein [Larkinella soli]|uniref:antA/AntB antirepressor family protein n=1 Tax=Larkinella soli TaxID=1770527 RepID=UPI000FFB9FA0|nr:antA/AntB antirepressor family protein [Larkinella soli]
MNALIPIQQQSGRTVVSARDLHTFLEDKQKFADWIKKRIQKYELVEGEDYLTFSLNSENGGRSIEYALTVEAAKELAMVQGNEKGKQARRYFIECEKRLQQTVPAPEAVAGGSAELMLQQAALLVNHAQQLTEQSGRLAKLETLVTHLISGGRYSQAAPVAPPPPSTSREEINKLINDYCGERDIPQHEAWNWLYDRLYQLYRVNIRGYRRQPGVSLLEVAERHGHLEKLYGIIMSELFYHDYTP